MSRYTGNMQLKLVLDGSAKTKGLEEERRISRIIGYSVSDLPAEEHCMICYTGHQDGKEKWHLDLFRSGNTTADKVTLADAFYYSPEDALRAVVAIERTRPGHLQLS